MLSVIIIYIFIARKIYFRYLQMLTYSLNYFRSFIIFIIVDRNSNFMFSFYIIENGQRWLFMYATNFLLAKHNYFGKIVRFCILKLYSFHIYAQICSCAFLGAGLWLRLAYQGEYVTLLPDHAALSADSVNVLQNTELPTSNCDCEFLLVTVNGWCNGICYNIFWMLWIMVPIKMLTDLCKYTLLEDSVTLVAY